MYVCRRCHQWLPLEAFVNRQRNNVRDGRDGACKACATDRTAEERERAKAEEVAKHFYEESRGQVDGRHRKVKNSSVSTRVLHTRYMRVICMARYDLLNARYM